MLADATVATLAYALARRARRDRVVARGVGRRDARDGVPERPAPVPDRARVLPGRAAAVRGAAGRWPACWWASAAAWRIEFAAFAGLGILLGRGGWRFAAAAVGTGALLYAPVVIAAGLGPSWDLLVDYPLTDFRDYQTLPFPLELRRAAEHERRLAAS